MPGACGYRIFEVSGTNNSKAKQAAMAAVSPVVKQALLDARAKKPVSVYGNLMQGARIAGKLLPSDMIFYAMEKWMK